MKPVAALRPPSLSELNDERVFRVARITARIELTELSVKRGFLSTKLKKCFSALSRGGVVEPGKKLKEARFNEAMCLTIFLSMACPPKS